MAKIRVLGTYVPGEKRLIFAMAYHIRGIGQSRAKKIVHALNLDENLLFADLSYEDISRIENFIKNNFLYGADLARDVMNHIKLQKQIKSYAGLRHLKGLPVRGQRTKTNARTRKGRRKTVANKKK